MAVPQGPHVAIVDVDANRVIQWTEFTPVFHGEGQQRRFSIPPGDAKVRLLAERCRRMRQEGKNVRLRFFV